MQLFTKFWILPYRTRLSQKGFFPLQETGVIQSAAKSKSCGLVQHEATNNTFALSACCIILTDKGPSGKSTLHISVISEKTSAGLAFWFFLTEEEIRSTAEFRKLEEV